MTDRQRLEAIIENLGISPMRFSKSLGYNRADKIYHILHNRNGLSDKIAEDIVMAYPKFNKSFILYGKGNMLIEHNLEETCENELKKAKERIEHLEELLNAKNNEIEDKKLIIEMLKEKIETKKISRD